MLIDNSKLKSYKSCPRMFFLSHVNHLARESNAIPLVFGSAWGRAMDKVWELTCTDNPGLREDIVEAAYQAFLTYWQEQGLSVSVSKFNEGIYGNRHPATALAMLRAYMAQRYGWLQQWELIGYEQPFAVKFSDTLYVGPLDKLVRDKATGEVAIIDHKSTGEYAKEGYFKANYLAQWKMSSQLEGYAWAYGELAKAGVVPKPKGAAVRIIIDAALVHKTVHDGFRLLEVEFSAQDLGAWYSDAEDWYAVLASNLELVSGHSVYSPAFPKNTDHCFHNNQRCQFYDLCLQNRALTTFKEPPLYFISNEWVPVDLKDPRLLTNLTKDELEKCQT